MSIFANSVIIKTNKYCEIYLPFVLAFCLIGGVVFLILGFKKNKRSTEPEMTKEFADKIIKKTESTKKFALLLLATGAVLVLIGYFSIENIAKIGIVFWIAGVFIGMFAKEGSKYRTAKNFIEGNKRIKGNTHEVNSDDFDNLMISQLPALYISEQDDIYRQEYFDRLLQMGFNSSDAEKMFEFECEVIKKFNKQYLLEAKFTQMWFFGLVQHFFKQYPKTKDDILKENFFTVSELCKIMDEAEWHFWNSHEKGLSDEVWGEIYEWRLRGRPGSEFIVRYIDMIEKKTGVATECIEKLIYSQGIHLSKYKW